MFISLLVPFLLVQQLPTEKIKVSTEATTVDRLVASFAKLTGKKLVASSDLENEVVLVQTDSAPADETLKRLALAIHAEWKFESGSFVLFRSKADLEQMRAFEMSHRLPEIQQAMDELKATASKPFDDILATFVANKSAAALRANSFVPPYYGKDSPFNQTPTQRALIRILATIDPKELVLQQGDRIVYSNKPTKVERQLGDLGSIFADLGKEQETWANAVSKVEKPPETTNGDDPFRQSERFQETVRRVVLSVGRGNSMAPVNVRALYLNEGGHVLGRATLWLTPQSVRDKQKALQSPPKTEQPFPLSEKSKKFESCLQAFFSIGEPPAELAIEPLRTMVLKPEESDLLSYGVTDGLLALAGERKCNLVAALPDIALAAFGLLGQDPKMTPESFLTKAELMASLEAVQDGNWLIVRSTHPVEAARERIGRKALGRMCRSIEALGYLSADEHAIFAATGSSNPDLGMALLYMFLLDSRSMEANDLGEKKVVQFYGMLTDAQRRDLKAGQELSLQSLSPAQFEFLKNAVYSTSRFNVQMRFAGDSTPLDFELYSEPTEGMPEGLPGDAVIKATPTVETVLLCSFDKPLSAFAQRRTLTPQDLGELLARQVGGTSPERVPSKYRLGKRRSLNLMITFDKMFSFGDRLPEVEIDKDSKPMTFDDLPKDIRDQVAKARNAAKSGGGGQDW